jgi:hypothetical protein
MKIGKVVTVEVFNGRLSNFCLAPLRVVILAVAKV